MKFYLLLLLLTTTLFASPTVYGPTGLIEMPSAESIAYKQVNVAVDYSINNQEENANEKNNVYYKLNLDLLKIGSLVFWEALF